MKRLNITLRMLMAFVISLFIGACGGSDDAEQLTIEQFKSELKSNGMTVGEESEKVFGLLHASNGNVINVNNERVEVYQFDTTTKPGREALEKWKKELCCFLA